MWGVAGLSTPDAVVLRVALKTAPLEQWAVAREMRQRIKARFDLEGIEIPFASARDVDAARGREARGAGHRRGRRAAGARTRPRGGPGLRAGSGLVRVRRVRRPA